MDLLLFPCICLVFKMCLCLSCVPCNHTALLGKVFLNWVELKTSTCVICEETSLCLPPTCQIIHHTWVIFNSQAHARMHTHKITRGTTQIAMHLFSWIRILLWGLTHAFSEKHNNTTKLTNFVTPLHSSFFPTIFLKLEKSVQGNNSVWVLCAKDNSPRV